ncbi:hypothetical protein EYF80_047741 [Liparis tanakae]|uniref:Uncharacterized protein n=1 Tax=Liparis tanakae TaxID=230148 RepID=A0A4Z2FLG8_9TELE|nr:hypothetical protein EYF80_047741 [Liparis tanakae]
MDLDPQRHGVDLFEVEDTGASGLTTCLEELLENGVRKWGQEGGLGQRDTGAQQHFLSSSLD